MPTVTDSMFRFVITFVIFLGLIGAFNVLYISSEVADSGEELTLDTFLTTSLRVFGEYPELLIFDIILGSVGIIGMLIVVRELLPV